MKYILAILLGLLLVCATVNANLTGCHIAINAQSRDTSYQSNGLTNTPYDINIVNVGTCQVSNIYVSLTPSSTSSVVQTWNLFQLDATHYAIENFDGSLVPNGQYSGGGYIAGVSNSNSGVTFSFDSAVCVPTGDCSNGNNNQGGIFTCSNLNCNCTEVCIQDGGIPRCENVFQSCPSTSSSTTSSTGSASTGCNAAASIVPRTGSGANWQSNLNFQIYDVTVTNEGSCTITSANLQFTLTSGSTISSSWNLDSSNNLINFGGAIYPGGQYTGVGIIVEGTGNVGVFVASKGCSSCSI